jgi:lipoprotein-releasing system ATP-binding protein
MIKTTDLRKSFTTPAGDLKVLKGIDVSIEKGEVVAVMGASGVGKSTLLHVLGALDMPTTGKVMYSGKDICSLGEKELTTFRNRTIGFVFQFHHLLPEFTALENVMMPALISGEGRVEAVRRAGGLLEELGVHQRRHHRPGELSGGEQQRVAVARALIMKPDVITGEELFGLLLRLNEKHGITFVIVTHNESLSRQCHRVIEMVDGRIN